MFAILCGGVAAAAGYGGSGKLTSKIGPAQTSGGITIQAKVTPHSVGWDPTQYWAKLKADVPNQGTAWNQGPTAGTSTADAGVGYLKWAWDPGPEGDNGPTQTWEAAGGWGFDPRASWGSSWAGQWGGTFNGSYRTELTLAVFKLDGIEMANWSSSLPFWADVLVNNDLWPHGGPYTASLDASTNVVVGPPPVAEFDWKLKAHGQWAGANPTSSGSMHAVIANASAIGAGLLTKPTAAP